MASLRTIAGCIGLGGSLSVKRDFFGLRTGKVPVLAGAPTFLSLREQIGMLRSRHFHLNVILVGSDLFTPVDLAEVDFAVHKCRAIYKQVNMGVGRILHFAITVAEADGRHIIDSDDEARDLTNAFTVHNNALDVFVVRDYVGTTIGLSEENGSCDKDKGGKTMSGSVVEISSATQQTARSFAHEVGHYLGLAHENDKPENLMCQSKFATSAITSVQLTADQGDLVAGHCFIESGCE